MLSTCITGVTKDEALVMKASLQSLILSNDIFFSSTLIFLFLAQFKIESLVIPANIFPSRDLVISILFLFNIQKFELDPSVI